MKFGDEEIESGNYHRYSKLIQDQLKGYWHLLSRNLHEEVVAWANGVAEASDNNRDFDRLLVLVYVLAEYAKRVDSVRLKEICQQLIPSDGFEEGLIIANQEKIKKYFADCIDRNKDLNDEPQKKADILKQFKLDLENILGDNISQTTPVPTTTKPVPIRGQAHQDYLNKILAINETIAAARPNAETLRALDLDQLSLSLKDINQFSAEQRQQLFAHLPSEIKAELPLVDLTYDRLRNYFQQKIAAYLQRAELVIHETAETLFYQLIDNANELNPRDRLPFLMTQAQQLTQNKAILAILANKIAAKFQEDYKGALFFFISSDKPSYDFITHYIQNNDDFNHIITTLSPANKDQFIKQLLAWSNILTWLDSTNLSTENKVMLAQSMSSKQFSQLAIVPETTGFYHTLINYLKQYEGEQDIKENSYLQTIIVDMLNDPEQIMQLDAKVTASLFNTLTIPEKKAVLQRCHQLFNEYDQIEDMLVYLIIDRLENPTEHLYEFIRTQDNTLTQLLAHSQLLQNTQKKYSAPLAAYQDELDRLQQLKLALGNAYKALLLQVVHDKVQLPLSMYADPTFTTDILFTSPSRYTELQKTLRWTFPRVQLTNLMNKLVAEYKTIIDKNSRAHLYEWFFELQQQSVTVGKTKTNALAIFNNYASATNSFYLTQLISQFEAYQQLADANKHQLALTEDQNFSDAMQSSVLRLENYVLNLKAEYETCIASLFTLSNSDLDELTALDIRGSHAIAILIERQTQLVKEYLGPTIPDTNTLAVCLKQSWMIVTAHRSHPNVMNAFRLLMMTVLQVRNKDSNELLKLLPTDAVDFLFNSAMQSLLIHAQYKTDTTHSAEAADLFLLESIYDYLKMYSADTDKLTLIKSNLDRSSFQFLMTKYPDLFNIIFHTQTADTTLATQLQNGVWIQRMLSHPVALAMLDKRDVALLVDQYRTLSKLLKMDEDSNYTAEMKRLRAEINRSAQPADEEKYQQLFAKHQQLLKFKVEHSLRELHRQFETNVHQLQHTLTQVMSVIKAYEDQVTRLDFINDTQEVMTVTRVTAAKLTVLLKDIDYEPLAAAISSLLREMTQVENQQRHQMDATLNALHVLHAELQQKTQQSKMIYADYITGELTQHNISGFIQSFTQRIYAAVTHRQGDIEQDTSWLSRLVKLLPHKSFMQTELDRKVMATESIKKDLPLYVFDKTLEKNSYIGNIAAIHDNGIILDRKVGLLTIGEAVYDADQNLIGFFDHHGRIQNENVIQEYTSFYLLTYTDLATLQNLSTQDLLVHDVLQQGQLSEFYHYLDSDNFAEGEQTMLHHQHSLAATQLTTYLQAKKEYLQALFLQALIDSKYTHPLSPQDCLILANTHPTAELIQLINAYINKDISIAKQLLFSLLHNNTLIIDGKAAFELFNLFHLVGLSTDETVSWQQSVTHAYAQQLLLAYQLTMSDYVNQLSGARLYDAINTTAPRELNVLTTAPFADIVSQLQFDTLPIEIIQQLSPEVRCEIMLTPANFPRLLTWGDNGKWGKKLLLTVTANTYEPTNLIHYFLLHCQGRLFFQDGFKYFYSSDKHLFVKVLSHIDDPDIRKTILNHILIEPELAKFIRQDFATTQLSLQSLLTAITGGVKSIRDFVDSDFLLQHIHNMHHGFYYSEDSIAILKQLVQEHWEDITASTLSLDDIKLLLSFAKEEQGKTLLSQAVTLTNSSSLFYNDELKLNPLIVNTYLLDYLSTANANTTAELNDIRALITDIKEQMTNNDIVTKLAAFCQHSPNKKLNQVIINVMGVSGDLNALIETVANPLNLFIGSPNAYLKITKANCTDIIKHPNDLIAVLRTLANTQNEKYIINFCRHVNTQIKAALRESSSSWLARNVYNANDGFHLFKPKVAIQKHHQQLNKILAITDRAKEEALAEEKIKSSVWAKWVYNAADGFHLFSTKADINKERYIFKFDHEQVISGTAGNTEKASSFAKFAALTAELKGKSAEMYFEKRYDAIAAYFDTEKPDEDNLARYIKYLHATKFTSSSEQDVLHFRIEFAKLFSNLYHLAYQSQQDQALMQIKIAKRPLTIDLKSKSLHIAHLKDVMHEFIPIIVDNHIKLIEGMLNLLRKNPDDNNLITALTAQLEFIQLEIPRLEKMHAQPYAEQLRTLLRDCDYVHEQYSLEHPITPSLAATELPASQMDLSPPNHSLH